MVVKDKYSRQSKYSRSRESLLKRSKQKILLVHRLVLGLAILTIPVMLYIQFKDSSLSPFEMLPDLASRVRKPMIVTVDKVVTVPRYQGVIPRKDKQFVVLFLEMECRFKLAYPTLRECFLLVDSDGKEHFPLSNSPMFIERGGEFGEFYLERDEAITGQIVFEIPRNVTAEHLKFDRAKWREEEIKEILEKEEAQKKT